jgi:MFS family permease
MQWSKEQPPPGQWSAPTGAPGPGQTPPPPPPGPGWGGQQPGAPGGGHGGPPGGYGGGYGAPGYGAWGGRWGGPPPAAKPGVIPLRPLGVGEILDGAVSTMRSYWRTVLGISLTVALLAQTASVLMQGLVLNDAVTQVSVNDPSTTPEDVFRSMGEAFLGSALVGLISAVGTIIATALLTTVTSRAVLGKPVSTGEAWRDARPQVPKLFGLLILLGLIGAGVVVCCALPGVIVLLAGSRVGGTALLVLGIIAAVIVIAWLTVRFSLASPALMLERQSIVKSLSRSAKLVRGSWWRVLGIQLLAGLIAGIVSSLVAIPFLFIAAAAGGGGMTGLFGTTGGHVGWVFLIVTGIGSVIGATITLPINAGVTVLLYVDQRIRREALDLELARAAGVQGYGSGTPSAVPGS